ncbi:MAG: Rrf2 family transcriptional regulator [Micrococcaceae bacterium]|nr:Rrf2 family transcriptional regulator [Micrococcaceae bacterium]
MKINAFSDVCLRILMLLAARSDPLLRTREIAEAIDIPYNQVSKAVHKLGQLKHIDVKRGRTGGVQINESGLSLGAGTLLRSREGQGDLAQCTTDDGTAACPLIAGCRLRTALARAQEAFYQELDHWSIRDLASSPALVPLPFPISR